MRSLGSGQVKEEELADDDDEATFILEKRIKHNVNFHAAKGAIVVTGKS